MATLLLAVENDRNAQNAEDLMINKSWDVVIAGGAVTGSSTAWWLMGMSPKLRVLVVEPDPTYAQSATALSVASVRQQFSNPINVEISRFGVDFIREFGDRIGPSGGVPSLGLKENGYLYLAGTPEGASMMEELAVIGGPEVPDPMVRQRESHSTPPC